MSWVISQTIEIKPISSQTPLNITSLSKMNVLLTKPLGKYNSCPNVGRHFCNERMPKHFPNDRLASVWAEGSTICWPGAVARRRVGSFDSDQGTFTTSTRATLYRKQTRTNKTNQIPHNKQDQTADKDIEDKTWQIWCYSARPPNQVLQLTLNVWLKNPNAIVPTLLGQVKL